MRIVKAEGGASAVMFALALPVLIGIAAIAVDGANIYSTVGRLQNAADAGALAAARDILNSPADARKIGVEVALLNVGPADGAVTRASDVEHGNFDRAGRTFDTARLPVNAVRVTARRSGSRGNPVPTIFAGLLGHDLVELRAQAIALMDHPKRCVFALDPTGSGAFSSSGSGRVQVPDCGIQVDSTSATAMTATGASAISAKENCVAGGYSGSISPTPARCQLAPDPLAGMPEPTMPASCHQTNFSINSNVTLTPDRKYCGNIKFGNDARVVMANGIYYFDNVTLDMSNRASLTVDNAMLYFGPGSRFWFTSSGNFTISPPTSGPYHGISIFGSRSGPIVESRMGGGATLRLLGAFYGPRMNLSMYGNSDLLAPVESGYIIANRFFFQGNSDAIFSMSSNTPRGFKPMARLVQ